MRKEDVGTYPAQVRLPRRSSMRHIFFGELFFFANVSTDYQLFFWDKSVKSKNSKRLQKAKHGERSNDASLQKKLIETLNQCANPVLELYDLLFFKI